MRSRAKTPSFRRFLCRFSCSFRTFHPQKQRFSVIFCEQFGNFSPVFFDLKALETGLHHTPKVSAPPHKRHRNRQRLRERPFSTANEKGQASESNQPERREQTGQNSPIQHNKKYIAPTCTSTAPHLHQPLFKPLSLDLQGFQRFCTNCTTFFAHVLTRAHAHTHARTGRKIFAKHRLCKSMKANPAPPKALRHKAIHRISTPLSAPCGRILQAN